uniref:Uncharacterized protein n=1 Tax=Plectus sambesii TaxID=2011161 RepID=A0A914WXR9_9BILA
MSRSTPASKQVSTEKFKKPKNRIGHPAFGCSRRDKVTCVSLHSLCRELLPGATKRDSTAKKEKHVSYSADIDDHAGQQQSQAAKSWYEMPEGGMAGVGNEHVLINAVDQQILAAVQFGKKPKQPIDSSKLPRRRASDAYRFISHLMCAESSSTWLVPGEWSVGQLLTMVKTDSNDRRRDSDGFFALRLTVKACSLQELLKSVSEMKTKPPQSSPSTLQFFARHGGLAILAQHLQLYQPTGANMPSRMSNSTREGTSGSGMTAPPSAFTAYPTYGPTDIYDDFEFIDLPASTLAANQNVWGTYTVGQSLQKAGNRLNQAMGTAGLSPHVVVAFSVFLRLAGYAELLVTCDRQRSKRLLRLAMGVTSDHGRSSREGKQSSDGDALSLLSFVVLDQLYREKSASSAEGRAIRQASMDLGVIDILLVCLASFAHQTPRFPELRETGPVPEAVYLIEQLLRATNAAESNSSAMGGAQVATAPTSTANEERGPQFWAKGTGFGSGTTQQQWNVDLHVMKRKQDEDTVTCLLKVLASFIYPDSLSNKEASSTSTEDTSENDTEQSEAKLPPTFSTLLKRSCLVPTLSSYLRNDSVLDISRHVRVYESVMALVGALAMMDELTPLLSESESGQSLTTMLRRLHDCINIYLSKLTKEQLVHINENSSSATTPVEGLKGQDVTDDQSSSTEEGLLKLAPMIRHACALITESK